MADETWKATYGTEIKGKQDEIAHQGATILEYAIPAINGVWDTKETQGLDQVALHGFTINELVDLGALSADDNKEKNILDNNLKGPVHPAFAIDRWETTVPAHFEREDLFPIGFDEDGNIRPGDYVASNEIVWQAILPSLLMASKFVENAHIIPWFSAVLHSDIYPISIISPETEKLDPPLRNLHFRPKMDLATPKMERATQKRIAAIIKDLHLGICDGKADPTGKTPHLRLNYDGLSIPPWADDGKSYRIYIAYQVIERLLEENIDPSTKLALQFNLTVALLNGFACVLVFAKDRARNIKLYFDNERISEAGRSFEINTFGGHPVLVNNRPTNDLTYSRIGAGFLLEDWLGAAKDHQLEVPSTGTDNDWRDRKWREARSIPISFLEELGQEDFWRCFVTRWGADALKVYPWTEGRLVRRVGDALQTQVYSVHPPDQKWLQFSRGLDKNPVGLSTDDLLSHKIARRRITREKEITTLLRSRQRPAEKRETIAPPEDPQPKGKVPREVKTEKFEAQRPRKSIIPGIAISDPQTRTSIQKSPKAAPRQAGARGSPPKTPLEQIGIPPTNVLRPKNSSQPFSGFGNPPNSTLSDSPPSRQSIGAPEDMSPLEVMRHYRTFKVINQARRNFFNGEYALAESGYLELLNLEATSKWQKARCNVFLASMPMRNDRAERAHTALRMYREILKDDPDDERRIVAVKEAKVMLKRVLTELGKDNSSNGSGDGKTGGARVKFGASTNSSSSGHTHIQPGSEVNGAECGSKDEARHEKKKEKERTPASADKLEQTNPKTASILNTMTTLLGFKRRREDNDNVKGEKDGRNKRFKTSA